jgi:hypothetical protein
VYIKILILKITMEKKNKILKSKLLLIIKLKESIKTKKVITIRIIIYL